MTLTDRIKAAVGRDPMSGDTELAVVLSTCARVEPELLRAVRLNMLPHLDVGAESDFWFSEWIGWRQPTAVAVHPDVCRVVWPILKKWLADAAPRDSIRKLPGLFARLHRGIAPALWLEERVTWMAVRYGDRGVAKVAGSLYRPLKAMDEDAERAGALADWVVRARRRLPPEVLDRVEGWHLTLRAKSLRDKDITVVPNRADLVRPTQGDALADVAASKLIGPVAEHFPKAQVPVRWDANSLLLGGRDHPDALYIAVPRTDPMIVQVRTEQGDGPWYDVSGDEPSRHPTAGGDLSLLTLDGQYYEVPTAFSGTIQAAPVLIPVETAGGQAASYWLQPVRYRDPSLEPVTQPSVLLQRAIMAIHADLTDVTDMTDLTDLETWRESRNHCEMLLLHGGDEAHRLRQAENFAESSHDVGWRVYRARQDPDAATWLTDELPKPGQRGVLVVVDHANRWHPRHLCMIAERLAGAELPVRVLAIAEQAGVWWEECEQFQRQGRVALRRRHLRSSWRRRAPGPRAVENCLRAVLWAREPGVKSPVLPSMPGISVGSLSAEDIPLVVVATVLTGKPITHPHAAVRVLLEHEHLYRAKLTGDQAGQVAQLSFLATLMRPCTHKTAQAIALDQKLIDDPSEWIDLLSAYERFYRAEPGSLAPVGPPEVADRLVADLLSGGVDEADEVAGVSAAWAVDVVTGLPSVVPLPAVGADAEARLRGAHNVLVVLARLARTDEDGLSKLRKLLVRLIRGNPALCVAAGGLALNAIVELVPERLAVEELRPISDELASQVDWDVTLDQAAMRIEEVLVRAALVDGHVSIADKARLQLRLATARHRAGYLWRALEAAKLALEGYERLFSASPNSCAAEYAEALMCASRLYGELGDISKALDHAEQAERCARKWVDRSDSDNNIGAVVANLATQILRREQTTQGIDSAANAVQTLRNLVANSRQDFRGDLVDALSSFSDLLSKSRRPGDALSLAEDAVKLGKKLVSLSPWAHGHRLARARYCLSTRLCERDDLAAALAEANEAEALLRPLYDVSPVRFQLQLAEVVLHCAELLARLGKPEAKATAETAVILFKESASGAAQPSEEQLRRAAALGVDVGPELRPARGGYQTGPGQRIGGAEA